MKRKFEDYTIEYSDTDETKSEVFNRLIEFFIKHEAFNGEAIYQNDNPLLDAPELLSDIAENIIQFKHTWNEDEPEPEPTGDYIDDLVDDLLYNT